jgi:hypothetical protein
LVALVAIVGLLGLGVNALFSATESDQQATEASAEPEQEADPAEVEITDCLPGTVKVTAEIGDANGEVDFDFNPTELPHMWYTITNNSGLTANSTSEALLPFLKSPAAVN